MMSSREPGIRGDFKPDPMQQLEILIAQSRRVRAKIVFATHAVRHTDFHDQARLGFGQPLPRITGELRLFVGAEFVGKTADESAGFQPLSGNYDRIENVTGRHNQQRDRLTFLFRSCDSGGEQFLLVVIEYLIGFEFGLAERRSTTIQAGGHHDHILLGGVGSTQHLSQVVEIFGIADSDHNVSGPHAQRFVLRLFVPVDPKLVQALRFARALSRNPPLRIRKNGKEHDTERYAANRGLILSKKIDDRSNEQHGTDENDTERQLTAIPKRNVQRNFPFAFFRLGIAEYQDGERHQGKAPDDTERIEPGESKHVAASKNDGEELHSYHKVDDAVAGTEAWMRLLKSIREHAVFGYAVQNSICTDDGSILCAGKNEHSNQNHKGVKDQLGPCWAPQMHGNAADQIAEVLGPDLVGNDHHREKRGQGGKQKGVNSNDNRGFLQILQLGMSNLAIHLSERFLAAHSQHRVSEANEHDEQSQMADPLVFELCQPAQRLVIKNNSGSQRVRRELKRPVPDADRAPDDQHDHHHGGHNHDLERLSARFVNTLSVFPPEINGDQNSEKRGKCVVGKAAKWMSQIL